MLRTKTRFGPLFGMFLQSGFLAAHDSPTVIKHVVRHWLRTLVYGSALLLWLAPLRVASAQHYCAVGQTLPAGQIISYEPAGVVSSTNSSTCNVRIPGGVLGQYFPSASAAGAAISGACNGSQYNVQVSWGSVYHQYASTYLMDVTLNGTFFSESGTIFSVCTGGYFVAVPTPTAAPAPLPAAGSTCSACKTGAVHVGHPIDPGSGNEFESVLDYQAGDPRLRFTRVYNSSSVTLSALGGHWQHNFSASIGNAYGAYQSSGTIAGYVSDVYATPADACTQGWARVAAASATLTPATTGATASFDTSTNTCQLSTGQTISVLATASHGSDALTATTYPAPMAVYRPDGAVYIFMCANGTCVPNTDVPLQLVPGSNGFTLIDENGNTEVYNNNGALVTITDKTGYQQILAYNSSNTLTSVTDSNGRVLGFGYNSSGYLSSVTQPDSGVIHYAYDSRQRLATVTYPDSSVLTYQYGPASSLSVLLTGVVDESKQLYASFSYDASGHAVGDSLAGGADAVSIVYNADGSATITDALGAVRTYQYQLVQGRQKISAVQGPPCNDCGIGAASSYDSHGYPASSTDFNGKVTATAYDANGLLDQLIEAQGQSVQRTTNTTWDPVFRNPLLSTVTNATGTVTASTGWVYNTNGQPLARCEIDPAQASGYTCAATGTVPTGVRRWTYTYCTTVGSQCPRVGLLLSVVGPRTDLTQTTTYSYYTNSSASGCGIPGDACYQAGDLYQVIDAMGHVTTIASYGGNGRITRVTDANGINTDLTYTPRGWLASRNVGGATTTIGYTPYGAVASITDPDNVTTSYTYDAAHRLTRITDAQGNYVQYTLDAAGNKTQEQIYTASGSVTHSLSRQFNTLGQLTALVDGLSHTVFSAGYSDSYDANGNLVHSADALGAQSHQGFDALNRLTSTIANYNGTDTATQNTTSTVSLDALDRLAGVTDPTSLSTIYTYDGLGNRTQLHSPDTGTSTDTYDAAGNRLTHTDANGAVSTSTYDAGNRLASISYTDTTLNVSYAYDEANAVTGCTASSPIGRLTRVVEGGVTTAFCYDARGNVIQKRQITASQTDSTLYAYTTGDRLSGVSTPDQTAIGYTYDSDGRVSGVQVTPAGATTAPPTVVSNVTWLPFGPISSYTLGNGQIITRTYDANYRLTDLTSPALNLHFARDAMGDITAIGNAPGANPALETYSYDPLYRLTGIADAGTALESYTYNPTGDRLSKTATDLVTGAGSYAYTPGTHQLASIGNAPRANDANGNTTGSVMGGNTYGFGYNGRNRLTVAQLNGQTVGTYTYNAMGERIGKVASAPQAVTERYAYNEAGQLIGEYGTTNRDYIWLGGLLVAVVDNTINGSVTTSTVNYLTADQLGAPRVVTDGMGTVIWQWAYAGNPFGEQQPTSSTGYVLNLRYPGQYFDAESGTNYNVFRTYEPPTGRYLQPDPIGFRGGISAFGYVGASPLGNYDPYGLMEWPPDIFPQGFVNGVAGVGDGIVSAVTFGFGDLAATRQALGIDGANECSAAYKGAHGVGVAAGVVGGLVDGEGEAQGIKWAFGAFKSDAKWASQLESRGWTADQITEAIESGEQFSADNLVNPGNPATRYVSPTTGQSVVQDNVTNEILHVGGPGFLY